MTDQTNPKDLMGAKKIDLSLFPDVAILYGALAMNDGAHKYGPYNWRTKHVRAQVYITAARRHLLAWAAGEEIAADSGVHHLGHVLGCVAILLDAAQTGALIDDRHSHPAVVQLLADANAAVLARTQRTQQQVADLIEAVTEATEAIADVPSLIGWAQYADVYDGNPTDPDVAEQGWQGGAGEGGPINHQMVAYAHGAAAREERIQEAALAEAAETLGLTGVVDILRERNPSPREPVYVTELDTEMTEAVDWDSMPRHPLAHQAPRRSSGWNGMKAGDICWDLDGKRHVRVDEFLQDGDAYVVCSNGDFITLKSNRLEFVGQMEVETHGQDRAPESSK
jgi:hypothetical protein